ncbi:MAG: hypothetical protein AABN34_13435 [Acidobacteriota bacterium]
MEDGVAAAEELEQALAQAPFAKIHNAKLHSFTSGECTLIIPFDESLERPGGIVAGSVLMAAADVAM